MPRAIFPDLISRWKDGRVRGTEGISGPEEAGLELKPGCPTGETEWSVFSISVALQSAMADCFKYATKCEHLEDSRGLPKWLSSKEPTCQSRRCGLGPWVRKFPWRRKWQPTLVFLPGKPHAQRSLVGHSPWGCKRAGHNLVTKQQEEDGKARPSHLGVRKPCLVTGFLPVTCDHIPLSISSSFPSWTRWH